MPVKHDAAWWREYRARKAGELPETPAGFVAASIEKALPAEEMVSLTSTEYELLKHSHDACDLHYAALEERFWAKNRALLAMTAIKNRLQIRVDYLERTAGMGDGAPEHFDDVRTILPAPDGLDELFG